MNVGEVKVVQDLAEELALGGWRHVVAITFRRSEAGKIYGDDPKCLRECFPGSDEAQDALWERAQHDNGEDKLLDAVLERYADVVLGPNFAAVDPDAQLSDTLKAIVTSFTDVDRAGPPGCLLARLQQSDRLGPTTTTRVEALRQQARDSYAALIKSAKARGEVAESIPTHVAAAMIDIQCNTVLVRMAAGEDSELLRAQAMLTFSIFD